MTSLAPSEATQVAEQSTYPLYNKTYTLHRLSPLHNFPPLTRASLTQHAQRLLSILRGDVLRGVRVGVESSGDGMVNAARLEACEWRLFGDEAGWSSGQPAPEEEQGNTRAQDSAGVWIELRYEKTSYTALLLRNPSARRKEASARTAEEDETHLPLLLMHMPSPLRSTVQAYLTTTFDTRIEEMRLSPSLLAAALEGFLADLSPLGAGGLAKTVRDIQLTLAFRGPVAPSLRTLDVTIRREDILGFMARGRSMGEGKNAGNASPFMTALGAYLKAHLALDLAHGDVGVSKVACGGFVMAREGRVKIMAPVGGEGDEGDEGQVGRRAVVGLMGRLFERAEVSRFEDELGG